MPKPKLLGEFLQEQQEPFSLEKHLLERGYHKLTNHNATSKHHNSAKISKNSIFGINKRRDPVRNCSDLPELVFSHIVSDKNNKRVKNSGSGGQDSLFTEKPKRKGEENAIEEDNSSSVFTTITMSNTCTESDAEEDTNCSESDAEDSHCPETHNGRSFSKSFLSETEVEADADRKLKRRDLEDNKQLSPVSVLEETESDNDGSPIHYTQCYSNPTQGESSSTTTYQCKLNGIQEMRQHGVSDSYYDQYIINKSLLRRSKKLLVDCTREVIRSQREKDKRREQVDKILGTDELWKLVCENVWLWSQDLIDETNILLLMHSDFWACAQEWRCFPKQQKREISIEIGDAILDDIIINDTFTS